MWWVFMKKKHKVLYLADMRTTIASNITKILEWEKICIFLKMTLKLLFSDLTILWLNHYAKILPIFGLGNILFSYLCCCSLTLKTPP